jgi:hypothetical protein
VSPKTCGTRRWCFFHRRSTSEASREAAWSESARSYAVSSLFFQAHFPCFPFARGGVRSVLGSFSWTLGRVFTFPIPTYNITRDFDYDDPRLQPLWRATARYGIPYFANFVNSSMSPDDARSMCCRLRLDTRTLRHRGGGLLGDLGRTLGLETLRSLAEARVPCEARTTVVRGLHDSVHLERLARSLADAGIVVWRAQPVSPARVLDKTVSLFPPKPEVLSEAMEAAISLGLDAAVRAAP